MRDGYDTTDLPPKSRLHVSALNPDVDKDSLKARFAKHGRVLELYVNTSKGFGFVQYGNPDEAANAVHAENQSMFEGRNIGVTYANKDRFGQSLKQDDNSRQRRDDTYKDREAGGRFRDRDLLPHDLPPRVRDRSPLHDRYEERFLDRYDRLRDYSRDREDVRRRDPYFDDRLPPPRDRFDDRYLPEDDYRRDPVYRDRERRDLLDHARDPLSRARDLLERGRDPLDRARDPLDRARDPLDRARDPLDRARDPLDRGRDPLDRARDPLDRARDPLDRARPHLLDREDTRDTFDRRGPGSRPSDSLRDPASSSAAPPPLPPTDKPIDCEILLLEKDLRDYADFVERRLKAMTLNTGLLLISNEGSLSQALEDVTRRKVLYAIILTSQNEVHRSVTLNILHGSPQEHRNMPLEDALALVDRNFTKYLQDQAVPSKITSGSVPPPVPAPLPGEPPLPRSQPPLPPAPPQASTGPALAVPAVELTIPQLINLLADRKQLTLGEMDRVIAHLQAVRHKMAVEQGINPDTPSAAAAAAAAASAAAAAAAAVATPAPVAAVTTTVVATKQVQPKPVAAVVAPKPVDSKQAELQAKILSIFNPGSSSAANTATTAATITAVAKASTPPQPVPKPLAFSYSGSVSVANKPQQAAVASLANSQSRQGGGGDINLDSPVVQKVLDKLILSGPTMLKQLATSANSISSNTSSGTQSVNKAVANMKNRTGGTVAANQQAYSHEQNEAQLRAAQQAALQTLQQQEASRNLQSAAVQPVKQTQPVQNQYQQPLVQYPQPGQYLQQQTAYQHQVASFQQQQVQYPPQQQQLPQQQLPQQQMHPQQLNQQQQQQQQQQQPQQQFQAQQATMPRQGVNPKPLLSLKPDRGGSMSTPNQGAGWPRGWKPATAQLAYSQRGTPSTVQYPTPNPGTRSAYSQMSSQRMDQKFQNRSQPQPPGI